MRKLVLARWVRVRESKTDRRQKLVTTTAKACVLLAALKSDLNALLPAVRTKQPPAPKPKAKVTRDHRGITMIPGQILFNMSESE
jgi:DNA-binding MarR family transcriptional regulator